jgi:hypothetical protein
VVTTDSLIQFFARFGAVYVMANFVQFTLLLWMGLVVGALPGKNEIRNRRIWGWIHKTAYYYICGMVLAMLAVNWSEDFGLEYLLLSIWAGLAFLVSAACKAIIKPGGTVVNGVATDQHPSEEVVFALLSTGLFACGLIWPAWQNSGPLAWLNLGLYSAMNGFFDLPLIGWILGGAGIILALYRMIRLPFLLWAVFEKVVLHRGAGPDDGPAGEPLEGKVIDVEGEKIP